MFRHSLCIIKLFLFIFSTISVIYADQRELHVSAFEITHQLTLPGTPVVIYDAITGDISGWWDHSFSELLKLIVRAAGQMEEKWPDTVDQVWQHFLFERLKPYIESKKHLK